MRPIHIFLAIVVAILYGLNYVAIPIGLEKIPPLYLSFIRLFLVSLLVVFYYKKPKVPFRLIVLYGLPMLAMQFSFIFTAINAGLSPTLAPILLQTQVFFTALFALVYLKEKLSKWQISGGLIAFAGIALVSIDSKGESSLLGIILILAAAISWALGNTVCKKIKQVDMSLVVWSCLIAWPPVLLVSLVFEGPHAIVEAFAYFSVSSIFSIIYLTYGSLLLGLWIWNRLISLYPLATVAPFTLLVPIFGSISSSLVFSIPFHLLQIIASLLVVGGLCVDMYGSRKKKVH